MMVIIITAVAGYLGGIVTGMILVCLIIGDIIHDGKDE